VLAWTWSCLRRLRDRDTASFVTEVGFLVNKANLKCLAFSGTWKLPQQENEKLQKRRNLKQERAPVNNALTGWHGT
jgi:hypothetical protein